MKKKHFALIGHPLSHTVSPIIHNHFFKALNINADYKVIDINPEEFKNYIPYLKTLDGYNVTIPYKQKIIPYLENISHKAALCESVNTVKNGKVSTGYTTDAYGFTCALKAARIPLNGRIVILGCGGVASVIAFEACLLNCDITIAVRDKSIPNAIKLRDRIEKYFKNKKVNVCTLNAIERHIDLLINATPVGMYPNILQSPIDIKILKNCSYVFDTIYNPVKTKLMRDATENGCIVSGGLNMLIYQAMQSEYIWNKNSFRKI